MATRTHTTNYKYKKLQNVEGDAVDQESTKWQCIWQGINGIMVIFFLLSAYVQVLEAYMIAELIDNAKFRERVCFAVSKLKYASLLVCSF